MKKISFLTITYILFGFPWLFIMITTSGRFTIAKTVLVSLLCAISFIEIIICGNKIRREVFIYMGVFVTYFFLSLIWGMINGYKFSFETDNSLIYTYIFTPIIVVLLAHFFGEKADRQKYFITVLSIITLLTLIMDLGKLLSNIGMIPSNHFFDFVRISSNSTQNELALRIANEASFMFLLPLFSVLFFLSKEKKNRVIYGIIIILGVLYSIMSGRKMLEIVFFGTLFILLINSIRKLSIKVIIKGGLICLVIAVVFVIGIKQIELNMSEKSIISKAWKTVVDGLNVTSFGTVKRRANSKALIQLWFGNPILGNGLNSYSKISTASSTNLWSYEVVYIALLAQTGLLGVAIFFIIVFKICKNLLIRYQNEKNIFCLAVMIGFICFIICGASNPLVYFIWPWTIALGFSYAPK